MSARAVEVVDNNLGAASDSNAVVLVVDGDVLQRHVITRGNIETIAVVSGRVAIAGRIGLISRRVVQGQAGDCEVLDVCYLKAVDRPVLDVEIGDLGVVDLLDDEEVVGLVLSTIGALAVPVSRTIALDDMAFGAGDGDVGTGNDDGVEVIVVGIAKSLYRIRP